MRNRPPGSTAVLLTLFSNQIKCRRGTAPTQECVGMHHVWNAASLLPQCHDFLLTSIKLLIGRESFPSSLLNIFLKSPLIKHFLFRWFGKSSVWNTKKEKNRTLIHVDNHLTNDSFASPPPQGWFKHLKQGDFCSQCDCFVHTRCFKCFLSIHLTVYIISWQPTDSY